MSPQPATDLAAIPKDLTELDQWLVWRYMTRDGKPTKVPYSAMTGRAASSMDPGTWCSFDQAVDAWQNGNFAGIGFVFSSADPYCGIDLDDCRTDDGTYKPWAQAIIERFADTYAEISPSGCGVKIFCKGQVPSDSGKKWQFDDGGIEMYDHGRFFTVTSAIAPGAPTQLEDHQADIDWIYGTVTGTAAEKRRADLRTTASVSAGARHNFLMSVAAQYRSRGMERSEILAALKAINAERCNPPKSDAEIEKIVGWVDQKPAGPRRRITAPQPITSAAVPQAQSNWRDYLILSSNGSIKPFMANAITALRLSPEWCGVLAYDEFRMSVVTKRDTPEIPAGTAWGDREDRICAEWMHREGIGVSLQTVYDAVLRCSQQHSYHPVRDYLGALQWDGEARIDHWLSAYLGAENDEYTRTIGARWLIQAVARIYQPGCKADSCIILEGEQGIRKSTALKVLTDPWFTDEIEDLGSKDAAMQTRGVWVIELAELDSLSRGEVSRIKAFMSRSTDRFRPPYGRHLLDSPRQCVFAGSVNHSTYLRDETGARRFWPVACAAIDVDQLRADRDQLWAEAVARYQDGCAWWIHEEHLIKQAKDQQAARYEGDPWDELIAAWIEHPEPARDEHGHLVTAYIESTPEAVTVQDVLTHCIGKRQEHWTQIDKNRVGRSLRALGWRRVRTRGDEDREYRWIKWRS